MSATRLPEVDVVVLGVGLVGSMMARELTRAGMTVVGLERGEPRSTVPDFQGPAMHDEIKYSIRKGLMQDTSRETLTFRNHASQTALPIRRWESFLPGTGVGGAAVHWNGQTYRFQDSDFNMRSHTEQRYGRAALEGLQIQDWGVSAGELERYFDRFEYLLGTSGIAGNLAGVIRPGGNPHEDPRSREYPTPPQKEPYGASMFRKAAQSLGFHPFTQPSSNLSQPYTNPEGMTLRTCMFCGFCERYGCEHYAKSSPQTIVLPKLLADSRFTLRTGCQVQKVLLDSTGRRATGVLYVDGAGRSFEQPASMVVVSMFALNNVRMLLLSGIGKPYDPASGTGVVGRNYAYQTVSGTQVFFDRSTRINPFMRSGASGTVIADFVGDNFDHSGLGFVGGAYIGDVMSHGRPVEFHPVPAGTPAWGSAWKRAVADHYNHTVVLTAHGSSMATRENYLDLDPTYKDAWGQPLLRMTFEFPENDLRMARYVTDKAVQIGKAMGGKQVQGAPRAGPYTVTTYQTTHNTGGTVMGTDPSTSVVNRFLQSWDVSNVFVIGASNFPQNGSYNPTDTVGALTYWAADAIVNRYMKSPGSLV